MKTKVKDGQTMADIAIQEFGSWEAMVAIAQKNGISITEIPEPGTELTLPEGTWNRVMQNFCYCQGQRQCPSENLWRGIYSRV